MPGKKRLILAFVCTVVIFFLGIFAYAQGAKRSAPPSGVTITFWHAMRGGRAEILRELIARFQEQNPEITVEERGFKSPDSRIGNDYNALYCAILEHVAQMSPPDIAQVYENWTTQLIEVQAIVPMESFFSTYPGFTQADANDLVPIFREANTFGGKLWTLPFNKSIYVLFYNRDLFDRYHLRPPATWEELRRVAKLLTTTEGTPRYGVVFTPSVDIFGHWLYANEGEFLTGNTAVFNSPAGIRSLEYWVKLANEEHSALPTFNALDDFLLQRGAIYIDTTSKIGNLVDKAKFNLGIAPLPAGKARKYQFAGTNLAIFAQSPSERRIAAWRFARFLVSVETTTYWAIRTGYLPVRKSAIRSPAYQKFLKSRGDFSVGVQSLDFAKVQPKSAAWESIRGIIDDAVYEALSQKKSPKEALDNAVSTANDLLVKLQGKGQ